jgi:hypothetical protein
LTAEYIRTKVSGGVKLSESLRAESKEPSPPLPEAVREFFRAAGRRGGKRTAELYGNKHFANLARLRKKPSAEGNPDV